MGRLFDSIEETLSSIEAEEVEYDSVEISDDITDTENNVLNDIEIDGASDIESIDEDSSIKYIKLTMDYRIMQCFKHTLDMNQVSLSRKYMVAALEELPFDPGNLLFSEIV